MCKPGDMKLVLGTHIKVERGELPPKVVLWLHMYAKTHVHICTDHEKKPQFSS